MSGMSQDFFRLLEAESARSLLQQHVPEFRDGRLHLVACEILRTHYKIFAKPSSQQKASLTVCYKLKAFEEDDRQTRTHIFLLKAFRAGRSKLALETEYTPFASNGQHAIQHFPGLDAIGWFFPHDPTLPHLREMIAPQTARKYLPYSQLPPALNAPRKIDRLAVEVIHYYPEHRCTNRYELFGKTATHSPPTVIYGKTLKSDDARCLYQRMERVWASARTWREGFVLAQPLGYDETTKTIWTAAVPGRALASSLNEAHFKTLLRKVAAGLARLHQSDMPVSARIEPTALLPELKKKVAKLVFAFPTLREQIETVLAQLQANAPHTRNLPSRLIHGDFQLHQLLRTEDKIALFDFDEMAHGAPAIDLASFIVDLWLHESEPARAHELLQEFYRNYCLRVDWEVSPDCVRWFVLQHCLTKAYRELTYRTHLPSLQNNIARLLELAASEWN